MATKLVYECKELFENKKEYLRLMEGTEQYDELKKKLSSVKKLYDLWQSGVNQALGSNMNYGQALSTKKHDPYLTGGAMSAAVGFGAGVYTGVANAVRNDEIDKRRAESATKARKDYKSMDEVEKDLAILVDSIFRIINYNPEIYQMRVYYYYNRAYRGATSRIDSLRKRSQEYLAMLDSLGYTEGAMIIRGELQKSVQKEKKGCSFSIICAVVFVIGVLIVCSSKTDDVSWMVGIAVVFIGVFGFIGYGFHVSSEAEAVRKTYDELTVDELEYVYLDYIHKGLDLRAQRKMNTARYQFVEKEVDALIACLKKKTGKEYDTIGVWYAKTIAM